MTERVVVALGSNLGERIDFLDAAVASVAAIDGVELVAVSSWYESIAHTLDGIDPEAPRYLNGVMLVDSTIGLTALLESLQQIEQDLGRPADHPAWSDRVIDLDIIATSAGVINESHLTVPHARAHERVFVLVPWLEIEADAELSGIGPVADVLATLDPVERSALRRLEVSR